MATEKCFIKEGEKEPWEEMDLEELALQYSPSRWSSRYSADDIIPAHVKVAGERASEVRSTEGAKLDVPYAEKERTKLDIFGQHLPGDAPVFVYVHGGYWQELHKDLSAYPAPPLCGDGVVTVVLGYTLAPQARVGEIVEEIRAAVAWVCGWACGRGSRGVVLAGWSAGAHLVTQVMSTSPGPRGVRGIVTLSGVFDLRPLVNTYVNDPLQMTRSEALSLSPLHHVGGLGRWWRGGKVLLAVGGSESPEFKRQSRRYAEACQAEGVEARYMEVEEVDHFNIVEELYSTDFQLTKAVLAFVRECCEEVEGGGLEEVE